MDEIKNSENFLTHQKKFLKFNNWKITEKFSNIVIVFSKIIHNNP